MKRTVSVEATVSFDYEIDDAVQSEWDGATILKVLDQRGRGNDIYTEDATLDSLLGFLGINLAVENRRMGNIDGWADFPSEAASVSMWPDWHIDRVQVSAATSPDGASA